ncbi:MAG: transcriptional regulator with AAA-type ATPase domain [Myxococcota bacterium]
MSLTGGDTLTDVSTPWLDPLGAGGAECFALVLVWSRSEPHRVGEVALFPPHTPAVVLGRAHSQGGTGRVRFFQQRPGDLVEVPELAGRGMSREQIRIQLTRGGLKLDNIGRTTVLVNGQEIRRTVIRSGDLVEIQHQVLLYCTRRPLKAPPLRSLDTPTFGFGEPDAVGMVGEDPVTWALRDRLGFLARRQAHVLILGESGTGKELAARAIHHLSPRCDRALISRNAATIPPALADAELFGNVKNYPNPGMAHRPGLVGSADGGTLFLDEFGELPAEVQTHLLRVLDAGGEYQRLGDATPRQANIRFIAATNRPPEALKADLVARLKLRVNTPPIQERRADIPLLARKILQRVISGEPDLGRFALEGEPRLAPDLLARLMKHDYTLHVRELESLLWLALSSSPGDFIALTPEVAAELKGSAAPVAESFRAPEELTREQIAEALDRHSGSQEKAWRDLGLSSRHVLYRLIKKHNIPT